jgi:hypothetical protein
MGRGRRRIGFVEAMPAAWPVAGTQRRQLRSARGLRSLLDDAFEFALLSVLLDELFIEPVFELVPDVPSLPLDDVDELVEVLFGEVLVLAFEFMSELVDELLGIALELLFDEVPVLLLVLLPLVCASATPPAMPMAPMATVVSLRIAFMWGLRGG